MPKFPKLRIAETRYTNRIRNIQSETPKKTRSRSKTPWKSFFEAGIGATWTTEIPKTSIRSIVHTYGKSMGKKFSCSYTENNGEIIVKIDKVERR